MLEGGLNMGYDAEQRIINSVTGTTKGNKKQQFEPKHPISNDYFLPNVSVLSGGGHRKIKVSQDAVDGSEARTLNIIFGTDETPPTASDYPIGTIYVQYTA